MCANKNKIRMKIKISLLVLVIIVLSCKVSSGKKEGESYGSSDGASGATKIVNEIHYPKEKHLKNVKQLTFGGDNAEAYWSFDNKKITFQANTKEWGLECDQIFTMNLGDDLTKGEYLNW